MIVGVIGKKRSGKDTIAEYLVEKHGFIRMSFADPMKIACKHIFYMTDEQMWGYGKEVIDPRYGVTPRKILQVMGTEMFQYDIYKHIPELKEKVPPRTLWVYRLMMEYEKIKNLKVVISDVRFQHEAEEILKVGGLLIKVIRPKFGFEEDNHASEKEIDDIHCYDTLMFNNGTIEELQVKIDDLLKIWKL